jgi:hypothetical protein
LCSPSVLLSWLSYIGSKISHASRADHTQQIVFHSSLSSSATAFCTKCFTATFYNGFGIGIRLDKVNGLGTLFAKILLLSPSLRFPVALGGAAKELRSIDQNLKLNTGMAGGKYFVTSPAVDGPRSQEIIRSLWLRSATLGVIAALTSDPLLHIAPISAHEEILIYGHHQFTYQNQNFFGGQKR